MTIRMLQRRGTASQWSNVGGVVVLQSGEVGINTTDNSFKIGDGSSVWNDLEYNYPDNLNELKYVQLQGGNTLAGTQTINGDLFVNDVLSIGENVDIDANLSVSGDLSVVDISAEQINVNGNRIIGIADPVANTDAANKIYVDNAIAGLAWKEAVHLIAHGTGANVALTGSTGTLVIDSHDALVAADNGIYRILLTAQTDATENGIYLYTDNGTSYTLTRSSDADNISELLGASVYVQEGTTYGTSSWVQSNYSANSFDDMVWVQFSGTALIDDGAGLLKNGKTLSVIGTENRISVTPDNVDIHANYVGQNSIEVVGAISSGSWEATAIGIDYGGTGAITASGARANLEITPANIGAALSVHNHNDLYYTETESDAKYAKLASANSFSGIQTIVSSDFEKSPLVIQAAAGQNSFISEWHTSAGSLIAGVGSQGNIQANNFSTAVGFVTVNGTYTIDIPTSSGTVIVTADGNVTFNATGYSLYTGMPITIFVKSGGATRNLAFPSGWAWMVSKPTSLAANKIGILTIVSTGSTEADCVASWVAQV